MAVAPLPADVWALRCGTCGASASRRCGGCGDAVYYGPPCAKADWRVHKLTCKRLAADAAAHGPSPLLDAVEVALWGQTFTALERRARAARLGD